METQLFHWIGWNEGGDWSEIFYKVILKVKIGEYEPDTKFGSAMIDYENGVLYLYEEETFNEVAQFKLKLVVE